MSYPKMIVRSPDMTWAMQVPNYEAGVKIITDAASEGMDLELVQIIETKLMSSSQIDVAPPPRFA